MPPPKPAPPAPPVKPAPPAKPTAPAKPVAPVKPAPTAAATVPPEVTKAFDGFASHFFAPTTPHAVDTTIALTSSFGFFRVYTYDHQGNPADKHIAILFHNKRSKQTWEIHGTIARKYLALLKSRTDIKDFPITDELVAQANVQDRVSGLSQYALIWNHATNDVEQRIYRDFEPSKSDVLVAGAEEYPTGMKTIDYKNWKGEKVAYYKNSREIRPVGLPSQILLHETATFTNMAFANIRDDGGTFLVPHFCINNIDKMRGSIFQFADIVEYTSHGPPLNARAIGIEFVNAPVEGFVNKKPQFNLDKSTKGIYLKTTLAGIPKLFLPLEFYPSDEKTAFSLKIPEADLINKAALLAMEVGPKKEKVVTVKSGEVTIASCRSDKFEHLAELVPLINRTGRGGANVLDIAHYRNIHVDSGRRFFIYQPVWVAGKSKAHHYGVDVRLPGLYSHGMTGVGRRDGHAQELYLFFKFFCGFEPGVIIQKIIDLLVASKTPVGTGRTPLQLEEKVTITPGVGEVDPKKPIKIKIGDYLDITDASKPPAPAPAPGKPAPAPSP